MQICGLTFTEQKKKKKNIVLFLGRQELAFRGHNESSSSLNKGNFKELFDMHIIRCSFEIQNHYKAIKNIFSGLSK